MFLNLYKKISFHSDINKNKYIKGIAIGFDIRNTFGKVSYTDGDYIYVYGFRTPWHDGWKMDSLEDADLFEKLLKDIASEFINLNIGVIERAIIVVPYVFTYLQKNMIANIADKVGIDAKDMDGGGIFSSAAQFFYGKEKDEIHYEVVAECSYEYFEISATCVGDGLYESIGLTGLKISNIPENILDKRIFEEINQYFKDINLFRVPEKIFYYAIGDNVELANHILSQFASMRSIENGKEPVIGCLLKELIWGQCANKLILGSINKDIWACIGEDENNSVVISRHNSSIPTYRSKTLMLLPEYVLKLYEGNFRNPAYDTLLSQITLSQYVKLESEIKCKISIDAHFSISIIISDSDGKTLIEKLNI